MFDKNVSIQAILYILNKCNDKCCDMHKINKILYFADQAHLSKYGRSITGDTYIAMSYGPVPSKIRDMLTAVRGDNFFAAYALDIAKQFHFTNKYTIQADQAADSNYLSESDIECLDYSFNKCKNLNFNELTSISHNLAWNNTKQDREISVKDILREVGDSEEYVAYVANKLELESHINF